MTHLPKIAWISFLAAAFVFPLSPTATAQNAQIRHVSVVKSGGSIQIQIDTSKRVVPLTEVVTDPDRLVIDFADAIPGPELRTVPVNQGEVKAVRVGRVTSNPPVTRVVVDLKSAQPFRLFPSSKSVMVKIGEGAGSASPVAAAPAAAASPRVAESAPQPPAPPTPAPAVTAAASKVVTAAPAPVAMAARVPTARVAPAVMNSAPIELDTPARVGSGPTAQIRHVAVLKVGGATEIEIETSQRVAPDVQAVTGPDRLVVDFPGSLPGPQLRAIAVNQGEVKGVRVGLLTAKPPVTRVVLDLKSAQAYQIFPSAKSVIVKLPASGASAVAGLPPANASTPEPPPAPPAPKKVEISFQDGRLRLVSNKASLAEVLNEIRTQLKADIVVPAGAEQEVVAVALGPSTPRDVISHLLDGSRYNFIIVGTDADANQVERVVLSPKNNLAESAIAPPTPAADTDGGDRSAGAPPPIPPPPPTEDVQPQGDSNPPPDTTPQPGDPQPAPN
jgi:hypothetical protein